MPLLNNNSWTYIEAAATLTPGTYTFLAILENATNIDNAFVCEDTDGDGLLGRIDLDSDGDGCSDANEFYKDANADGGDDGEYGLGAPVVDSTTGVVIAASYVGVVAPEIVLNNTSEDLGGNDINGQQINLGQTFEYVLRFQNFGDDNAQNLTIRNQLPPTVNYNTVDVTGAPGTTFTFDAITNELVFTIPNNLVEIGDPEYTIRIEVMVTNDCSSFTAACSSTLINNAYVTYQGTVNTTTFSDEPGGTETISGCPRTSEFATNEVGNDLLNCDISRTVELCGDNVLLTAGEGFETYNWAIDANNNGQIDSNEALINDGDSDNDPSTLLVTDIGNYIVEKIDDDGCANLTELIAVERFGETQNNPIIDYFNQVNSDGNLANDIQGELVTCPIDGDILPKIFLCGDDDEVLLQLGITDADFITWEQLDEASCDPSGDDCANKNGTCTWNSLVTQDNYTVTEAGEYRVVINYQNGCFSRFYFNVFENNLDIDYTTSDIICNTPGNIRITNVSNAYGFQLLDTSSNTVVIPFSANNGPNFDINTVGSYIVQVTPLNPSTGTPLAGACVFETPPIGILNRDFQVAVSSEPQNCNTPATVTVQALNVLPTYNFELRLDDGSNGGLGSLVNSELAANDNTFTFTNVNPGNYLVYTSTQDGCEDSQPIIVAAVPDLSLSAITLENITCNAGVVNLSLAEAHQIRVMTWLFGARMAPSYILMKVQFLKQHFRITPTFYSVTGAYLTLPTTQMKLVATYLW